MLRSSSDIQNKNRPYDPSSLLRLFFILNLFNSEYDFYKSKRIDSVLPRDYLSLCGFSDQLPCYTTYFYFKQRFDFNFLLQYLNLFLVLFLNSIILFFKDELNDSNGLVISADSKPLAAYGNIPLGIIHSYNKTLNGKYGFKVFWLAVVYPFYFPFYFSFDKASAHDNPIYKFRPRIETLNSSLTRWFNLKNVFYFPNIYTYDRFNLRLIAKAISHYTFKSNASFSKRLKGETHDKKRICLNSRFTFQRS